MCKEQNSQEPSGQKMAKGAEAFKMIVRMYMMRGDYFSALDTLNDVMKEDPNDGEAWALAGKNFFLIEHYYDAYTTFGKALELRYKTEATIKWLEVTIGILSEHPDFPSISNNPLRIDSTDSKGWRGIGYALIKVEKYQKALIAFKNALEIDSNDDVAWFQQGRVLDYLGQQQEALDAFTTASNLNPKNSDAWFWRGEKSARLGKFDDALFAFSFAVKLEPNSEVTQWFKGEMHLELGQYEEALSACTDTLALNDKYINAWKQRGEICVCINDCEQGANAYQKALSLDSTDAVAWASLGVFKLVLGEYDNAALSFENALHHRPELADVWVWKAILSQNESKQPAEERLKMLNEALKLNRRNTFALGVKAKNLELIDKYQEAFDIYNSVLEIEPDADWPKRKKQEILDYFL